MYEDAYHPSKRLPQNWSQSEPFPRMENRFLVVRQDLPLQVLCPFVPMLVQPSLDIETKYKEYEMDAPS